MSGNSHPNATAPAPRTHFLILLGTGQTKEKYAGSAPVLTANSVVGHDSPCRFVIEGVGVPATKYKSLREKLIHKPLDFCDKLVGFGMKYKIESGWVRTADMHKDDRLVLMGNSRGGYSAQILAQILRRYGLYSTEAFAAMKERRTTGVTNPTVSELHLYALDPVGTYGILRTPSEFLGFKSKGFWTVTGKPKDRGHVVLMRAERRIGFSPNVLELKCNGGGGCGCGCKQLQQIWFDGFHRDAWGPSKNALPVLAYILHNLAVSGVRITNLDKLVQDVRGQNWLGNKKGGPSNLLKGFKRPEDKSHLSYSESNPCPTIHKLVEALEGKSNTEQIRQILVGDCNH